VGLGGREAVAESSRRPGCATQHRRPSPPRPRRSCPPWSPGSRSTCCVRPGCGGRRTSRFRDRDGKIVNTWALDIQDGQIQTIRTVLNPDKLAHVGPVADAWAVLHEAYLARRPTA